MLTKPGEWDDLLVPAPPGMPAMVRFVPRSDAHRIAHFAVPKNACTSLKEVMHTLARGAPFGEQRSPSGRLLTVHNIFLAMRFHPHRHRALRDYYTFVVVRDPVQRLVSCFRNRVQHYRELSPWHLGRPHPGPRDLRPDPGFREFVERLEDYRLASPSIAHHSNPHSFFLGTDLGIYSEVFAFPNFAPIAERITGIVGHPVEIPHTQTAGGQVAASDLTDDLVARIRRFYEADYDLVGPWLR